jgi:colicin import membrane protein
MLQISAAKSSLSATDASIKTEETALKLVSQRLAKAQTKSEAITLEQQQKAVSAKLSQLRASKAALSKTADSKASALKAKLKEVKQLDKAEKKAGAAASSRRAAIIKAEGEATAARVAAEKQARAKAVAAAQEKAAKVKAEQKKAAAEALKTANANKAVSSTVLCTRICAAITRLLYCFSAVLLYAFLVETVVVLVDKNACTTTHDSSA